MPLIGYDDLKNEKTVMIIELIAWILLFVTDLTNRIADRNYGVYERGKFLMIAVHRRALKNRQNNTRSENRSITVEYYTYTQYYYDIEK